MSGRRLLGLCLVISLVLSACAAPQPTGGGGGGGPSQPSAPKRVSAVVRGDVPTLVPDAPGPVPGLAELVELVNVGMTTWGPGGGVLPRLAEEVPSTENGLWKVFPDGRMETTWKLRRNALWHDGAPLTADDFLFRAQLYQDQRMPFSGGSSAATLLRFVDTMAAPDPHTLVIQWKSIYLQANQGFDFPFPKHILESVYAQGDAERFLALPHWTTDFVGVGAFKVKSFVVGSGATLEAFDGYFLGRPRIDTIDVKFIVDPNTIGANILAGEVDVTFGGRLPLDWAQEIKDRSPTATFGTSTANPMVVYQNLQNPVPAAILQPDFRRALAHALDRKEMVDSLVAGLTTVAHATVLNPGRTEEFREHDPKSAKYEFDQHRAMQLIEGLGYRKGADGVYRDASGQPIVLEIRTSQGDIQQERSTFAMSASWEQIGLETAPVIVPSARRGDDQYRNTFPGFDVRRNPHRPDTLKQYFHSANAPTPERSYRGSSYIRYFNTEWDALIDLHDRTVPDRERNEILGRIVQFMTDQVLVIGLFYDVEVTVWTTRLQNVHTRGDQMRETWNAHEWNTARP